VRLIKLVNSGEPATAPVLTLIAPTSSRSGEVVGLTATVAANQNPVLRYRWDFGDGTAGSGQQVTYAYTHSGKYKVRLTAETVDGPEAFMEQELNIEGDINTRFHPSSIRPAGNSTSCLH
jgi:hypothetical protein